MRVLGEILSTLTVIRREVIFPPFTHDGHDGHHKLQFYAIYERCFQVIAIECRFPAGYATTEFCVATAYLERKIERQENGHCHSWNSAQIVCGYEVMENLSSKSMMNN